MFLIDLTHLIGSYAVKSKCGNSFTTKIVSIFDVHVDDVLTFIGMVSPWISFIHGDLIGIISTFSAVDVHKSFC